MDKPLYSAPVPTPDGKFTATYTDTGLCGLTFPPVKRQTRSGITGNRSPAEQPVGTLPPHIRRWHAVIVKALANALAGRDPGALPPLDLSRGTEFQRGVWSVLSKIKRGKTLSYGEVAKALGRPGATRAVGSACGANPVPVLIPCHRVLAAGGRIGGFSADMKWKRMLLTREGVYS